MLSVKPISAAEKARDVVARLFAAYAQDATLMPDDWQTRLPTRDPERARVIADFIAGMSEPKWIGMSWPCRIISGVALNSAVE